MLNFISRYCYSLILAALVAVPAYAELPHAAFDMDVRIDPPTHELSVDADIELPAEYAGREVEFLLTNAVEVISSDPPVERLPYEGGGFTGINGSSVELTQKGNVARYRVRLPDDAARIKIKWRGPINFKLGDLKEQYTRGFRETAGIIGDEGIYLAGSSLWYPYFSNELVTFRLESNVPDDWQLISQGNGTSRDEDGMAYWDSGGPVDEIYLVGGPLLRYAKPVGPVMAEVYLHEPDEALTQRYLTATAQYLEMYRNLIGPYPYKKFALVENFWETGYGMPSFTLLGPQIIRFPFILTSSYPHEILHNWWGNSVFVDYSTGNWCEGLTAYMADHLIQEQHGAAANYRRDTLKKYRDFVKGDRDFPLTEFRSRHSAATEAVGYGKTLMGFHMLRRQMGDDKFRQTFQRFYRDYRDEQASFDDIRTVMEAVSGLDLNQFFTQWVTWTGAPDLAVRDVRVVPEGDTYVITGEIDQLQEGPAYSLEVPVYITTSDKLERSTVPVTAKQTQFRVVTAAAPQLVEVDPEFDLFRLLDPKETAPSIGQIFGDPEILAVLPSDADPAKLDGYRQLIEAWRSDAHDIRVVSDTELDEIPTNTAAWLFGAQNRLAATLFDDDTTIDFEADDTGFVAQGQRIPREGHSAVIVKRHPDNETRAIGWIVVDPAGAFTGVANKLPHYGKYSFLGFAGDATTNMVKGEWAATDSPLRVDLRSNAQRAAGPVTAIAPPKRAPLAELPPVFSRERLMEHVEYLASDELAGRGLGTAGLIAARDYIVEQFAEIGLTPGGDANSFLQTFRVDEGEDGKPHDVSNIIGYIPGSNPKYDGQATLVTAHYDHLGHGWPDARADEKGSIYHGADDNASGVAIMIEVARAFAEGAPPERSIVFVAFTAEEAGLLGSQYYVQHPTPVPLAGINGVVNMDTVGRLGDQDISVFGADSASEWPHVFRGIGFSAGIGSKMISGPLASSDHKSFIDVGIPAVQISSGANLDYHRPSDTADKIDSAGMVKIAAFVKEAAGYLAQRPEPLTATIDGASARTSAPGSGDDNDKRRVSVGTVPDFAFQGNGVRVDSIVPGSPAAVAGIKAGDILVRLADQPVKGLRGYTDLLKSLTPGQTVPAVINRDGATIELDVTVHAR